MSLEIVLVLIVIALIGGAVLYHNFHTKGAVALANLEGRVQGVENAIKGAAASVATTVTTPPPAPPAAS